jgi:catechol 2,3-dioxygenase-like lactoylglutathione lyase family enzyme
MISGAHAIIYSRKPEADRAFLRDVLGLPHVDAGDGWLIFALPPAELAIHPGRRNSVHELYLMCDDIGAFVRRMKARGIRCGRVQRMPWGRLSQVRLPGGGAVGVYEPRHARPRPMRTRPRRRRAAA